MKMTAMLTMTRASAERRGRSCGVLRTGETRTRAWTMFEGKKFEEKKVMRQRPRSSRSLQQEQKKEDADTKKKGRCFLINFVYLFLAL